MRGWEQAECELVLAGLDELLDHVLPALIVGWSASSGIMRVNSEKTKSHSLAGWGTLQIFSLIQTADR